MNQYYKLTAEQVNKIGILIDNIEVAKGANNIINFASLVQLLQQIEVVREEVDDIDG